MCCYKHTTTSVQLVFDSFVCCCLCLAGLSVPSQITSHSLLRCIGLKQFARDTPFFALANCKRLRRFISVLLVIHREGDPRGKQENLDMTKNTSKLIELKLAVIQYHDGDQMDYLQSGIARDACYTSFNSLSYKKKQMADAIADYETAVNEGRDAPQMRILSMIERMEVELEELEERHFADCAVYTIVTDGQEWEAQPKRRAPALKSDKIAALKKRVAA